MSGAEKTIIVRTEGEPLALADTLRSEVRAIDPHLALYDVITMAAHLESSTGRESQTSFVFGCFAAVALFLAAVGLYGVLAFSVAQRRHEIGIRMALGARPTDVLRSVIYTGLELAILGVVFGGFSIPSAGTPLRQPSLRRRAHRTADLPADRGVAPERCPPGQLDTGSTRGKGRSDGGVAVSVRAAARAAAGIARWLPYTARFGPGQRPTRTKPCAAHLPPSRSSRPVPTI